jgi:molybdenum ABC transporter molybdate-binding protein
MNSLRIPFLLFSAALPLALTTCSQRSAETPLQVFCAANLKKPVEAAARQFQDELGVEVQLQFGGSGTLVSQLRVAKQGDLFIASDEGSLQDARRFELVREVLPLAKQHPVIAVTAGNPKKIATLEDLLQPGLKVALANPEATSIGRITKTLLSKIPRGDKTFWDLLAAHVTVMKPTVTEIAADLSLGTVDAAITFDSTLGQFPKLQGVEVSPLGEHVETASAGVLAFSKHPGRALQFARYLNAPEKGGAIFKSNGFTPAGGDAWAVRPELILYSGGVNRPAIEPLLQQFADREGIELTTVFNGCGILCATMKTMGNASNPRFPDVYYACDLCFVPPVAEHFRESVLLTQTSIGIALPPGNPGAVKTLSDLARPGLRLGLCNAQQSTLGFMTQGILKDSGLLEAVRKNVAVEVPTADFLVNQLRAGGLDAVIVYQVNTRSSSAPLEFIPIQHPGAQAVQPFAVRDDSAHRLLGLRLLAFLKSHRASFEQAGFAWRGDAEPVASKRIEIPPWLKTQ